MRQYQIVGNDGKPKHTWEECQKNLPRNEFCELKAFPKKKNIEDK